MSPARRLIRAHTIDQPEVHEAIAAMRQVADEYGDRVMIGEAYLPIDRLMAYYGVDLTGFHLPFNFHLISTPWQPSAISALVSGYEKALPAGGWPNWVLGNHDRSRVASRIGPKQARLAAMLLLTLRGTPTIYQGEEIGMTDVPISTEYVRDSWERNVPGLGLGRDPVRTPIPWRNAPHGGFTTGKPWLPLGPDLASLNIEAQIRDPTSMLSLYRALLRLRRAEPALSVGTYVAVARTDALLVYERRHLDRRLLIALNMSNKAEHLDARLERGRVLLSTDLRDPSCVSVDTPLNAYEGWIMEGL